MKDEALDFLPMILLLGIVVSISFGLIMPIYRESREMVYDEVYDKTLYKVQGEQHINENVFDTDYSYAELIVALSNQSYFMPSPRVIDVCGTVLQIQASATDVKEPNKAYTASTTTDYIPGNRNTAKNIQEIMYAWCRDFTARYGVNGYKLHFIVDYSVGSVEGYSDDCYAVFAVAYDSNGNRYKLRCRAGGLIEKIPNVSPLSIGLAVYD